MHDYFLQLLPSFLYVMFFFNNKTEMFHDDLFCIIIMDQLYFIMKKLL